MVQCEQTNNESILKVDKNREKDGDKNSRVLFATFREEQLVTELQKVSNQLNSYRLDNDELAATVIELRQLCGSARERICQSEEKIKVLENQLSTAYETIEELNHKISEQELIMCSLKQEVSALMSELKRVQFREIRLLDVLETKRNLQKLCVISDLLGNVFTHIQNSFSANEEYSCLEPFVKQTSVAVHHLSTELSNMMTLSTKPLLTNPISDKLNILPYESEKLDDNLTYFEVPLPNSLSSLHNLKMKTDTYDESNSSASTCCDIETSVMTDPNSIMQSKKQLLLPCSDETMLRDTARCQLDQPNLNKHTSILNGVTSSIEKQYRMICHYRKRDNPEFNETSERIKAPLLTNKFPSNAHIMSDDDSCKPRKRNGFKGNLNDYYIKGKKIKFPKTKQYFSRRQLASHSKSGFMS
jgi:uncharacterized coiled-coil protein SlyX